MFSPLSTTFLYLILAAGLALSQSLSGLGLSQPCETALSTAIANPNLANCLNILGAVNILETTANTSIVQPVDTWITGVCTAAPCNNATLTAAANNITTGCATDLAQIGVTSSSIGVVSTAIVALYPTIRQLACLKDTNVTSKPFCVTELLTDLQAAIGKPLSIQNIEQIPADITGGGGISLPKNLTCSSCTQAAWTIIKPDLAPFLNTSVVDNALSQQCGAAFIQASGIPSNIVESTGTAAAAGSSVTSTPSGALRISSSMMAPLISFLAVSAGSYML